MTLMHSSLEAAPRPALPTLDPPTLADVLGVRPHHEPAARNGREHYLRRLLLAADVIALLCALLTIELSVGIQEGGLHSLTRGLALLLIAIPSWVLVTRAHDRVSTRRAQHDAAEELGSIFWMTTLWSWSVLLLAPLAGIRTPAIPKLAAFWLATLLYLLLLRTATRAWARRRSWYRQNALMVGAPGEAEAILPKLLRHPEYGIDVVATIELPSDEDEFVRDYSGGAGVPIIRGDVDLLELIGELAVDRVIFGPSLPRLPDYQEVLCGLKDLHVHVDMVPSWYDAVGAGVSLHELEGMALIGVPNTRLSRSALLAKRALDMVTAGLALLVLSPVLIACAIAIKLDSPGPVLFRQRRVGRGDQRFEVLKFRSMRADAEARKDDIAHLNFHGGGTGNGMFKIQDDPRVTRVGRLLRRHSLDELPQLINVLKGDMSLVGPRPLIESEDDQILGRHRRRITLTPGLTGLWQVNGRSDIPFEGMIDLDYLYVANWSLWGDVKLLLKTVGVVTRGRGAY